MEHKIPTTPLRTLSVGASKVERNIPNPSKRPVSLNILGRTDHQEACNSSNWLSEVSVQNLAEDRQIHPSDTPILDSRSDEATAGSYFSPRWKRSFLDVEVASAGGHGLVRRT